MKDYLSYENQRNKRNAKLYTDIIKAAFGEECQVLIGHHLTFEQGGDLNTENEIPSADTLMFDHEIMRKIFGERAKSIMMKLAEKPVEERDEYLKEVFELWMKIHETVNKAAMA